MKAVKALFAAITLFAGAASQAAVVPVGIQTNVSVADVTSWGWTTCYEDNGSTYTSLDTVKAACSGKYIMMGDKTSSTNFGILAAALRSDVFFNTGDGNNVTHTANGTEWYFSTNYSMGFTALGNTVMRNSCDINLAGWSGPATVGACWHTYNNALSGGWEFNNGSGLQYTSNRTLLMSNGPVSVPEPTSIMLVGLGMLGLAVRRKRRGQSLTVQGPV